ncbi:SAVED domain-containing protein [Metabacillus rhizolycopersici]|uniref:SAVED domain-containing protein n=1 Tax=Metabacillus rhizolycopersici TaxID=2875709 RepID=A0ABS7UXT5_9BACI|nr:SAVED domain-containing protein [Metabacillus rhizolycopersici]MBZ5753034.1 SAVED domain-containing protein [Metabacillus rhizolycopersici]
MIYWIIAGVIILIGGYFTVRHFANQNKELGVAAVLVTAGLSLIVGSFGSVWDKIIQILAILKNSQTAQESINITKEMSEPNLLQLLIGIALLAFGIYFWHYIKNKIYILNINAYQDKRIEGHNRDLDLGKFEFKEREIDFIRIFSKDMKPTLAKQIAQVIKDKTTSFKDESKEFKRGYTGIAPIPFVALSGTYLKKEKIDHYFEFDKKTTEKFYELKSGTNYPPLELQGNLNNLNHSSEEIVVAVSITTEIPDAHLTQFAGMDVVRLSVDNPEDNKIQFKEQLMDYANKVVETIEELGRQIPHLKNIHFACSSQSCLALEIGKKVDDRRMVQVICYFFDMQQPKKYSWGLVINGKEKGKLIQA